MAWPWISLDWTYQQLLKPWIIEHCSNSLSHNLGSVEHRCSRLEHSYLKCCSLTEFDRLHLRQHLSIPCLKVRCSARYCLRATSCQLVVLSTVLISATINMLTTLSCMQLLSFHSEQTLTFLMLAQSSSRTGFGTKPAAQLRYVRDLLLWDMPKSSMFWSSDVADHCQQYFQ